MPFTHADPHARRPLATNMRLMPSPPQPDTAARERFAKRRAAGLVAETLALAVGRSTAETGTARLAAILAAEAGALTAPTPVSSTPETRPQATAAAPITVVAPNLRKRAASTPAFVE